MEIENLKWDLLKEEGITKADLELVDLNIEHSPVIPIKGSKPMECIKLEDGMYRVPGCEMVGLNLSESEVKVMRYRYLINRPRPPFNF